MEERTVSSKEGDGSAVGTGTSSSSNTMNIILRIVWIVIVEDVCDIAHIFKQKEMVSISRKTRKNPFSDVPARTDGRRGGPKYASVILSVVLLSLVCGLSVAVQ